MKAKAWTMKMAWTKMGITPQKSKDLTVCCEGDHAHQALEAHLEAHLGMKLATILGRHQVLTRCCVRGQAGEIVVQKSERFLIPGTGALVALRLPPPVLQAFRQGAAKRVVRPQQVLTQCCVGDHSK